MLDKIHNIAEIIAAFAIVGSLIFVGVQIDQNTQAIEAQEDAAAYMPWLSLSQMMVPSSDFADIYVRGQSGGFDVLSEGEKVRFDHYFVARFVVYEQNYRAWKRDPSLFSIAYLRVNVDEAIKVEGAHTNKGSREWWTYGKTYFQPDFVTWADQVSLKDQK